MNPEARTCAQDVLRAASLIHSFLVDKTFDSCTKNIAQTSFHNH